MVQMQMQILWSVGPSHGTRQPLLGGMLVWMSGLKAQTLPRSRRTELALRKGKAPEEEKNLGCQPADDLKVYFMFREQQRHIRKNHIKFLRTQWTARCPSKNGLFCRLFYIYIYIENNRQSLGHRPLDLCLSPQVSQGHPTGVPGICLKFMWLLFS